MSKVRYVRQYEYVLGRGSPYDMGDNGASVHTQILQLLSTVNNGIGPR